MTKIGAHIVDIARFLPKRVVFGEETTAQSDEPVSDNDFFKVPKKRHFAFPECSAADLGVGALNALFAKTQFAPEKIDAILFSNAIGDYVNISIGPDLQYRSGAKNAKVMQIDTGCVSFLSMLNAADAFIKAGLYRNIAIVTVTNFVSRLKDFQKSKKSFVLGDGASATLVVPGEPSVVATIEESKGEYYGLMLCRPRTKEGEPERFYFEPSAGPLEVEFSLPMLDQLKKNAVELVTSAVNNVLEKANVTKSDVNWLLTHQPNVALIGRWREAIGISHPRVFDTFHDYGNLFQSSLPVTMSEAIDKGLFKKGDWIVMGTFANGGDYVGASLIKW